MFWKDKKELPIPMIVDLSFQERSRAWHSMPPHVEENQETNARHYLKIIFPKLQNEKGKLKQVNNNIMYTWISIEEVTLGAQSDKSDIRRSSGSVSFDIGILYLNTSSSPFDPLLDVLNFKPNPIKQKSKSKTPTNQPPVHDEKNYDIIRYKKEAID